VRPGATDALALGALLLLAITAAACRGRVPAWRSIVLGNAAVALAYLIAAAAARWVRRPAAGAALRAGAVCGALAYLFSAVAPLQLVIHGRWLDGAVIALEQAVLGVQPVIWLQRLVRPWLTEAMMFAYVAYVVLYPLVCAAIWRVEGALERCLLALAVVNVVCDLGFIVLPVAGPVPFLGDAFTVPLRGWVFTWMGELIRTELHYVGGSLPSPHCAAATVLWVMAWRYRRPLAVALAPLVLTLFAATVYCRYHYASDAVAGIAVAAVALAVLTPWARRGGGDGSAGGEGRRASGGARRLGRERPSVQ
jgi:membrane-associated phospholipid phosphatase